MLYCGKAIHTSVRLVHNEAGSVIADPKFVAPERHDYRLAEDSPAPELGFVPFDASQAGVYGDAAWVARARDRKFSPLRPNAIPPPPFTLDDGFENTADGALLMDAQVFVEGKGDAIVLSEEAPAAGKHCLEVRDQPGLKYAFNPHFYFKPEHWNGRTRVSFDLRLGPDAKLYHEWREYPGRPYFDTGPSLHIEHNELTVAKRKLLTLPQGEWVHFEVEAGHGDQATDTWRLSVTLPNAPPHTFDALLIGSPGEYRRLTWLGFVSDATADVVFWLDNLHVEHLPAKR